MSAPDRVEQPLAYSERDLDRNGILSRKTRYVLRRKGKFPRPKDVDGTSRNLYVGDEIRAWLADPTAWAANNK